MKLITSKVFLKNRLTLRSEDNIMIPNNIRLSVVYLLRMRCQRVIWNQIVDPIYCEEVMP